VNSVRFAYANALECGPHDCYQGNFTPLNPPQSDLGHRADSHWALPQISS